QMSSNDPKRTWQDGRNLRKIGPCSDRLEGDMGRQIREGGHPAKQQRRAARSKLRKVSTGVADLREQLDRRTRELDDALQQQVATSEVLRIIRHSPADAQPVFDAIVQSASRLCGAIFGVVYLYDGDRLRIAATNNFTPTATIHLNELQ